MKKKSLSKKKHYFFMASCLVIYIKDDAQKQRHINILMQSTSLNIAKADLNSLNQNAIGRIVQESDVAPKDVKDVVFLNIACLGHMTEDEFHGEPEKQLTTTQ